MDSLSPHQVEAELRSLPGWSVVDGVLTRTFQLPGFPAALRFVNQVGELAEEAGHHPDMDIRYNKVKIGLITHDAGGLTGKDFALAAAIDRLTAD